MKYQLKIFSAFIGISLITYCTGIIGDATVAEIMEFGRIDYAPRLFCSNQAMLVTYAGTNIERCKLITSGGEVLLDMRGYEAGSGITPPMNKDWLPFSVKIYAEINGETETKTFELLYQDQPRNIDNPEHVSYISTSEILSDYFIYEEYDKEPGYINGEDASDGIDWVRYYNLYKYMYGFSWSISLNEFSSRSGLLAIKNSGAETLKFSAAGLFEDEELDPGETLEIDGLPKPPTLIYGRYEDSVKVYMGRQKGEIRKPEDPNFWREFTHPTKRQWLTLRIVCKDD